MFKSCGNIIFWQKLCSSRQTMPSCVSLRREMVFRKISHIVHPISPLTHFRLGTGIWTRVPKGTEHASSFADGCSVLPSEGEPHMSGLLFSKHSRPTMLCALKTLDAQQFTPCLAVQNLILLLRYIAKLHISLLICNDFPKCI